MTILNNIANGAPLKDVRDTLNDSLMALTTLRPHPPMPALRLTAARMISDDAAGLADVENFLGTQLGCITAFAETNNAAGTWLDSLAATRAQVAALKPLNRPIYWGFPLCHLTPGHQAAETLRGDHDATIRTMFEEILACNRPLVDPVSNVSYYLIRLGWEMQFWLAYPWCRAHIDPGTYRALFRRIVAIAKSVSPMFFFDFTPNIRVIGADNKVIDPRQYFPGRDVVSAIGTDAYLRYEIEFMIQGITPAQTIANVWDGEWGINQLYSWAESLDLPFLIAETGINGSQDANNSATGDLYATHIHRCVEFVRSKRVVMCGYWNKTNSATQFNCRLTDLQYPKAAAAWKAGFEKVAKPWTPLLHFGPELIQWHTALDGANMTLDSTTQQVTTWPDRISGKALASSASARPVYSPTARNGRPGVTADGADDILIQTDVSNLPAFGKAVTNFVQAFTFSDAANFSYLLSDTDSVGGGTNTRAVGHNGGNLRFQSGGAGLTGPAIRNIDANIVAMFRDSYSATQQTGQIAVNGGILWSDGLSITLPPAPMTKRVLFGNGAPSDGVANRIRATVQELGSISRTISREELALLQGYLAWTWGCQSQLPAHHPYKAAAPTYGGPMPTYN